MEDETNVRLLRDDNDDDIEGHGGVSYGSPSFVSQSEALQYQMARVDVKVDQLNEMHLKHLRRPTLDEESQEESNIKRLTNEITQVSIKGQLISKWCPKISPKRTKTIMSLSQLRSFK